MSLLVLSISFFQLLKTCFFFSLPLLVLIFGFSSLPAANDPSTPPWHFLFPNSLPTQTEPYFFYSFPSSTHCSFSFFLILIIKSAILMKTAPRTRLTFKSLHFMIFLKFITQLPATRAVCTNPNFAYIASCAHPFSVTVRKICSEIINTEK